MKTSVFKESPFGRIDVEEEGSKPTFFPSLESSHPCALALGEALFWTEISSEHGGLMARFLPPDELPGWHDQAIALKDAFARIHEQCQILAFEPVEVKNTIKYVILPWARQLLKFKLDLEREQRRGTVHSLNWPSFLAHLIRENGRFIHRLRRYLNDQIEFNRNEIIDFWSPLMAEHLTGMAHQLDPEEKDAFALFMAESQKIQAIRGNHLPVEEVDPLLPQVERVLEFKSEMAKGLETYQIDSMMAPELPDHTRREAVMFKVELLRADAMIRAGT